MTGAEATGARIVSVVDLPDEVAALFGPRYRHIDARSPDAMARIAAAAPDVLLCSAGTIRIDAETIPQFPPSVRAVATYSVGFDHIDLAAAKTHGLAVFNTPDVLADSVADAALLLMLGAARRATESIALIRSGAWAGWSPRQLNGIELRGRRLGILGMGGIGRRIARRARAFGMEIGYTNRRAAEDAEGAEFVPDFRALVRRSDILVLACPSTAETRRILGAEALEGADPGLIVVNVGRGDLVDDEALISALAEGRIYAAGLDVFDGEPAFDPRYLDLPNVFMLPHIGSSTMTARIAMGAALVDALRDWEAGRRPRNQIA